MPRTTPMFWSAALANLPRPVRRWTESPAGRRLIRFGPAAGLALAATQVTYFICASGLHTTGRVTGAAGWLAGAVVSYAASRWAWERRGRPRLLQETLPFVAISMVAGLLLIEASHLGYVEAAALGLHGIAFVGCAQGIYLAANIGTFLARFVLFNLVVFADRRISPAAPHGRSRRLSRETAREVLPELARFSAVTALGVLASGTVTGLLPGPGPVTSGPAAAALAVLVSYVGNRYWTFRYRRRRPLPREGGRYLLLSLAALAIQIGGLRVTTSLLDLHGQPALTSTTVAGVALVLLLRYWCCRTWVWQAPRPVPAAGV
jgi:putative flippase GtrA